MYGTDGQRGVLSEYPPPEVENLAKYPPPPEVGSKDPPPLGFWPSRSEAKIHQKSCKIARKRREIGKFCDISKNNLKTGLFV